MNISESHQLGESYDAEDVEGSWVLGRSSAGAAMFARPFDFHTLHHLDDDSAGRALLGLALALGVRWTPPPRMRS